MRFLVLTLLATLAATPAYALRINNCDGLDHEVQVHFYQETVTVALEPNESRTLYGVPMKITMGDQKILMPRYDDVYCIWDNKIRIQRRGSIRRGGL